MANSQAKKKRLKQLREQGKDVTTQRSQLDFSTHVRMTKTKRESLDKRYKKHKRHFQVNHTDSSGNAFSFGHNHVIGNSSKTELRHVLFKKLYYSSGYIQ
ncbi:hypothetical protein [Ureibacillus aquaedulcis]|uniref:YqkK n=1 Tax=Ureibacillus aquaedulcis TaxID=3058421 RepID=A0ABT8GNR9_9BACL|nr:hypothetical protein [Ureibacillus sp. BA0131]MDN4492581.1 hypothetical protein [Ureibacillus sp. BA0131]